MPRYMGVIQGKTEEFAAWPQRADYLWVDVGHGEADQLKTIVHHLYPAHHTTIERVLGSQGRRPSLVVEDDALVFILADMKGPIRDLSVHSMGFFLGKKFLVTVHIGAPAPAIEQTREYMKENDLLSKGVDFALAEILYRHLHEFHRVNREIDDEFESLHRRLLEKPYAHLVKDILKLRRESMTMLGMYKPELEIFNLLHDSHLPYVQKCNRPYFNDLKAGMDTIASDASETRSGLGELVEAYSSMQSNEINKVMKFLTILSVLALPATTIASIYGMNFSIPELHWPYGYWYSLVLMGLITTVLLLYMKRHGWFGRR